MSDNEKDYVAVVLEEVRDNFRAFGESLDFAQKKATRLLKRSAE